MIGIEFQVGNKEKVLLRSYEYGYELCWQRLQKGAEVWTPEKYFTSVGHALQRVMELKIKAEDVHSLSDLMLAMEKARREIVETWQEKADTAG